MQQASSNMIFHRIRQFTFNEYLALLKTIETVGALWTRCIAVHIFPSTCARTISADRIAIRSIQTLAVILTIGAPFVLWASYNQFD